MYTQQPKRAVWSLIVALVAVLATFTMATAPRAGAAPASVAETIDPRVAQAQDNVTAYCTDLVDDSLTTHERNTRLDQCRMWTRELADRLASASPSPTATATGTTPPPPTTTPPITTTPPATTTAPPTIPPPSGWPGFANTGVPAGVTLKPYSGTCLVATPNTVIDGVQSSCVFVIQTTGVIIRNSRIQGVSGQGGAQFAVTDTEIDVTPTTQGAQADGISGTNFTATRVNVHGSNRGIYCDSSGTIVDSWIHGTEIAVGSNWHASAVRVEQHCTLRHNTLACDTQPNSNDGGCSADLTGYPDFNSIKDNLIDNNLFVANPTGNAFCAYGGNTSGKAFSTAVDNATYIRFINNVFQHGTKNGAPANCAAYGPITDFAAGRVGNVWSGNVWDTGGMINSDGSTAP